MPAPALRFRNARTAGRSLRASRHSTVEAAARFAELNPDHTGPSRSGLGTATRSVLRRLRSLGQFEVAAEDAVITIRVRPHNARARARYYSHCSIQRVATWVRGLGIAEKGLSPLHAWRHTFKKIAARNGIEPGMRDAICGHSPRGVADYYEMPTLEDMAEAIKKFPRTSFE
jgi:integrase